MKWLRTAAIVTVLVVVAVLSAWWIARRVTERPRTKWKDEALERLWNSTLTNAPVLAQLAELREAANTNEIGWAHDNVLLMTNGQYIVYEYRHGANDFFPPHLFLGRTSENQWLYSSYHFCRNMQMVQFEAQPGSIEEFCRRYFARRFDGKSDECLRMTR